MKKKTNDRIAIAVFILPSLLGFIIFLLIPIFLSIVISFTNYSGSLNNFKFTFNNYINLITSSTFLKVIFLTGAFVFFSVILQNVLGFIFALILNNHFRGRNIFRGIIFLPVVISSIAICLSFMLILNPSKGPLNNFLASLGMPPQPWLASPNSALSTILLVFIWQLFGYYMVIYLSGLQSINPELYNAAEIDGANSWQKLFAVTLPGLTPVIFFSLVISIINSFKVFDFIFIMTGGQLGGGPAGSTTVIVFDIYTKAFTTWETGYASAESIFLLLFVLAVTIFQNIVQKKWVTYDII